MNRIVSSIFALTMIFTNTIVIFGMHGTNQEVTKAPANTSLPKDPFIDLRKLIDLVEADDADNLRKYVEEKNLRDDSWAMGTVFCGAVRQQKEKCLSLLTSKGFLNQETFTKLVFSQPILRDANFNDTFLLARKSSNRNIAAWARGIKVQAIYQAIQEKTFDEIRNTENKE